MMTSLSITMIILSVLFLIFIIKLIRSNTFNLESSLLWLVTAVAMVFFAIFPGVLEFFASLFGFETMSNFLLVTAVLFSLVQLIIFTKHTTKQTRDIKTLIQEVSILKEKMDRKEK